ncbi:hypothetical protein FTO74_00150 [Granulicella sp. WH15]|nr:hypothetical protein FTO74_00150 [Granulicella sp. WH15]
MEMEVKDELSVAMERLMAAAGVLEVAAEKLAGLEIAAVGSRELELEEKLRVAEATISALRAEGGRKTLPAGVSALLAKQGEGKNVDGSGVDAALVGLSMEQRIAVKAQLMRAGLIG